MHTVDDRPAAGAAGAASDGAATVDGALALLDEGLRRLGTVDPAALPEADVTAVVRQLGRLGGRMDGHQARFVAAADAAGVPERSGATSTTSWVAEQTGRSRGQSVRTGRLAKASATTPELTDAVSSGDVGVDQAVTIASGLERGELEASDLDDLLPAARRQTPEMFRRRARQLAGERRQQRLRDQELIAREARSHRQWRLPDGSLRYEGQMPPAEGDAFEKAISAFHEPDGKDVPDDERRTFAQRSSDALSALVAAALRAGEAGDVAGVRPHVTVTVPYEALASLDDAASAGATAITDLGTVLSMAAFRKLACDATFRRLVIGPEGQPLDVGRATRQWSPAIRAAITAVEGGCRGPGCDLPPHRCIIHHIRWWEQRGETSVTNGAQLCDRHHNLIHDDGWTLEMHPGTRRCTWTAPDGTVVMTEPRGPAAPTIAGHDGELPVDGIAGAAPADPVIGNANRDVRPTAGRPALPGRPGGRGDPGRPRSHGLDPPDPDRPRDAPATGAVRTLQLEI